LTPYLDRMLPEAEHAAVDRHLAGCAPCRRAEEEARGGRTMLRQGATRLHHPAAPPGLRGRCEAAATPPVAGTAAVWFGRLVPGLAAALIVLATMLVVFAMATRRSNVLLAQQLTVDHMKCFHLLTAADAPALDADAAEEMMARRYGWNVRVPPSSEAHGITLVGARRCLYASGTIPHVLYRVNGEDLSLFVLTGEHHRTAHVDTLGHQSEIWSEGDTTYVLVSSEGGTGMVAAAQYLMQASP
jgi:anti-sigma factor RsiW